MGVWCERVEWSVGEVCYLLSHVDVMYVVLIV